MLTLLSFLFGVSVSGPAPLTTQYIPLAEWHAHAGDRFIVDTEANIGYLAHETGSYTSFKVGSGKRRMVRYLGRTYDATTPEAYWVVKSTHIQGDKGIFGKTGVFLRLYRDGTDHTPYGIHSTGNIDELLASDDRYKSMGCILVNDDILSILQQTYTLNGDSLEVVTLQGIDTNLFAQAGR